MANTNSARKAARKIERRTEMNKHRRTQMRNSIRAVEEAIASGDPETATAAMRSAESVLARAGQIKIIHRKTASRKVSRLYQEIFKLRAGPSDVASPLLKRDREKERRLAAGLAELAAALRARSRLDDAVRDVAELRAWMDVSGRSSNEDGWITRDVAKACAAASVQVLVAGSIMEKQTAFSLMSVALDSDSASVAGRYLQERLVPCVTEISSDIEPEKPFAMGPIRLRVGASRAIRTLPASETERSGGSTLVKIPTWGSPLHFRVRVSAPHALVEPHGDVDVMLPLDRVDAMTDLLIVPKRAGSLPLTIDYMLDGSRFARRILVFEPSDPGSKSANMK